MSKFSDLCSLYKESRETYAECQKRAFKFSVELMERYLNYLDIPNKYFKYVPLKNDPDPQEIGRLSQENNYTVRGATHLKDDTYWHIGLVITVFITENTYPQYPVFIDFKFKEKDNGYIVIITDDHEGYLIHGGNETEFNDLFNFIQIKLQDNFKTGLQRFLEQSEQSLPTIGFIQPA